MARVALLIAVIRIPWLPRKFQPRAAAGRQHPGRGTEVAQALQPLGAVLRQPSGELGYLAPMRVGRPKQFF